ncbi:hypothetical protein D9756_008308 [Leucocoprinus leucothites]|uniref:BHLH domain-containing protein n=1 Tax=Leucocoprinus leucothites TaxID=201217 RepID=A0A8H5D0F9_9AGAR|nr:hypothetical protein D9756_008308 [Leucoagaricus leucothites]
MAENEDLIVLDRSDPLNLIINNAAMDDSDPNATPPDWSQLGALWSEEQVNGSNDSTVNSKQFGEYLDFNMASNMLDMDMDMSLAGSGIEPSSLHLGASDRLGYPFDDPFQFASLASPADILAAQFPLSFDGGDTLMDSSSSNPGLETPNTRPRRLSATSSSSSSGPSFSPLPESIPSPGYLSPGGGYTSDSTHHSSAASFANSENSPEQSSFIERPATTNNTTQPSQPAPISISNTASPSAATQDFSNDPAAELAQRVRESAGVMLAVPMNGSGTPYQAGHLFPTANALQTKLPIPRLQRPATASPPKSSTPSVVSSAASTPPPSTPPPVPGVPGDASSSSSTSAPTSTASITAQPLNPARPKTSHTTIERRYRTNLNARIQSLRMAVPALRVLEDRDSGSSKKIKKNLKSGVLFKSANGSAPHGGAGPFAGVGAPLNPYGEVDAIDERGYVDGVKVARKCSKANVLGKAVEYIRVLKRREIRLRAEQDGLKSLVCGLVGGPALLREWEREWRERFGGEERDEVPLDGGEGDDEGDDEDEDEDEDDDGENTGKKRKRAKVEKDLLPLPKKEPKAMANVPLTADGQPEKRKRGRPRKTPLPPAPSPPVQPALTVATPAPTTAQQSQQPQQYLLAVFALFSFFNSPLTSTSSNSHHAAHQSHGHVLSPAPVPLAYAPEIVSQFNPPAGVSVAAVTWHDWAQIAHLAVTILLFISVAARMTNGFGFTRLRKLVKPDSASTAKGDEEKKVEMIILCRDAVPSFTSALTLYRSLTSSTSPITRALFLYTLSSSSSTPALARPVLRARARAIWSSAPPVEKKSQVTLSSTIEDVYAALPSITPSKNLSLVDMIAECLIKRKLSDILGKWFVREVNSSASKDKKVAEEATEDFESLLEAAKGLGGEVAALARNVERIKSSRSDATSSTTAAPIAWKAVVPGGNTSEEDSDDSDDSSLSASVGSLDDDDLEDEEEETQAPSTILRALVLYRSLFSSTSPSTSAPVVGLGLLAPPPSAPPTISVEPPTPTIPTHVRRRPATTNSTIPSSTTSLSSSSVTAGTTRTSLSSTEQQRKMYTLRKLLGSRVFEKYGEVMEDARDRVVDMLVDAERQSLRARV